MRSSGPRVLFAAAVGSMSLAACATRPPCDELGCPSACPRDSAVDATGRCACTGGTTPVLGACVRPAVGDGYCGPAERMTPEGCVGRPCAPDEAVDVATGTCAPRAAVRRTRTECPDGSVAVDRASEVACLPAGETCPEGTRRADGGCARPSACPPGTLFDGAACKPFVTAGVETSRTVRVDAGVWAAIVLGVDGGPGSADLCRRVERRADAFGMTPGEKRSVVVHVALTIPDQDVSRAAASVWSTLEGMPGQAAVPAAANEVIERAVGSLVELFRGLGGESSTAALRVAVHCDVAAP